MSLDIEEIPTEQPGSHTQPDGAPALPRHLSKVPEITGLFWLVKILTTAMGEATSDFLARRFGPAISIPVALLAVSGGLFLQFRADRYRPWIYWFTVSAVAVFGTRAADGLHTAGLPFYASTSLYAVVLALVFVAWYRHEGTLSIHSIFTPHRESFYWATVLATFALGTATGDMTASSFGLGYLTSGIAFAVVFVLPGLGYRFAGLNPIVAFWFAYVVTRPLGASFADWFSSTRGLDLGTGAVSLTLAVLIVGCVAYLAFTHEDVEERRLR